MISPAALSGGLAITQDHLDRTDLVVLVGHDGLVEWSSHRDHDAPTRPTPEQHLHDHLAGFSHTQVALAMPTEPEAVPLRRQWRP
ncbi:hypothetical protein ACFFQW_13025 [Umezawaea endophytica]|uniref:Uncharacterized protein n=1 Tax=Umezawaea endophytica TaxID=1654476 RepID=A0A9X3AFG7_9PSEU|nr:hypothetical protein [Umezawaea endophytica]MCS7478742.1 hypothetical protein [Umezawaea endophytica]